MDKRDQSKKDEIILRQLEVIRSMTEHNLSRMGADFWGTPTPEKHVPVAPLPEKEKRIPPADGGEKKAPEAAEQKQEDTAKAPPKENIEDLQKELDSYVGLSAVKREVKDLINLAAVERLAAARAERDFRYERALFRCGLGLGLELAGSGRLPG